MGFDPWIAVAVVATLAGYLVYLLGVRRRVVEPNRASWLIWGCTTTVEAVTYSAANRGTPQALVFLLSAAASLGVALALWGRSRWSRPDPIETLCMAASLVAILVWLAFREALWAHLLAVLVVPIGFWPTWRSVRADRTRERSPAWGLWTLGDLATLLVASRAGSREPAEYLYALVELACHAGVWLIIGLGSAGPLRRLGARQAGPFEVRDTHLGKAVFAARGFAAGETITSFGGERVTARFLPGEVSGAADRYLQIAPSAYLGPSGAIDDLVNHSCAPNAGVRFLADGVTLVALRDIAAGEEIAWDYATTVSDPGWSMTCRCGAAVCRGTIRSFATLPQGMRNWYLARNVVAPYLCAAPLPRRRARAG